MSTQLQKVDNFKAIINTKDMVRRISTACGSKELAGQFMASMLDLYEGDNYLQNCDPQKVVMECLKAASLNLPLVKGLGFAYVVPYKNVPTFTIGYKGMIQLALRSGQYKIINADAVYEGETIRANRLTGQIELSGEKTSDTPIGYFAYFQLVNGFEKTVYMTVDEIREHGKKFSASFGSSSSPWKTNFDSMAKKTVLRKILKYGPMSTDMQEAERMDFRAEEARVQAEISANANKVEIVDDEVVAEVNPETGEVVDMAEPDF